ncbi:MAG: hypothetical protein JWP43_1613 [Ramlibacter sp.]|nr:hypothetical protein [Ramlibacter sp.]
MSTKKKPAIVKPAEWQERTSLRLSSRSGTTREMDTAYTRWYNSLSQPNASITEMYRSGLQTILETYYSEHGASWDKLERNKASNGLIQYIYELIKQDDPKLAATRTRLAKDNVHSRYGVLYLLGNIDIDMSFGAIALEGVGAIGGALAGGFGTDFSQIHDVDKVDKVAWGVKGIRSHLPSQLGFVPDKFEMSVSDTHGYANALGTTVIQKGMDFYNKPTSGATPARIGTRQVGVQGGSAIPMAPPLQNWGGKGPPCAVGNMNYLQAGSQSLTTSAAQSDYGFPLTVRAFKAMKRHPIRAIAFAPLSGAVLVGAAFTDAMAKVIEALTWLIKTLIDWLREKLSEAMESPVTVGLDAIKGLVLAAVKSIAASAVPFVGAGIDLAVGIGKSFNAIKMKVGAWLERRKIRITDGHPALLASKIESMLTRDIMSGLWVTIKGAIQMALAATIPGIQSLVSAMATAAEWVIKFVMRLSELAALKLFLLQAKVAFMKERKLTAQEPGSPHRTVHETGGMINDLEEFKKFYQKGCNASPIIAMLTLNTGICGSQWQLQTMFSDIGLIGQKEFNSGTAYFTRLKDYGRKYLKDCGFEFTPDLAIRSAGINEKRYIEGLLNHAKGIHKQSDRMGVNTSGIGWATA